MAANRRTRCSVVYDVGEDLEGGAGKGRVAVASNGTDILRVRVADFPRVLGLRVRHPWGGFCIPSV